MSAKPPLALHVTQVAEEELKKTLAEQTKTMSVRLYVVSGLYPTIHMTLDTPKDNDEKVEAKGVPFLVDAVSRNYLSEATVDCIPGVDGPSFKITGPNVPQNEEHEKNVAASGKGTASASNEEREGMVKKALKKVFDPEIPMNILDLGLIYGMDWSKEGKLNIQMTMTSPGCPVAELLVEEVKRVSDEALGGDITNVEVVWEPPWGPDKMSEFAKRQFGYA